MAVGPVRPGAMGPVDRGRMRRGVGGFALAASGSESAGEAAGAGSAAPPGSLLALQESGGPGAVEDRGARARRRATEQATEALEDLRGLQLAMLGVNENPAGLERLAKLAAGDHAGVDPALAGLLAEVSVRARVELARRRRS